MLTRSKDNARIVTERTGRVVRREVRDGYAVVVGRLAQDNPQVALKVEVEKCFAWTDHADAAIRWNAHTFSTSAAISQI